MQLLPLVKRERERERERGERECIDRQCDQPSVQLTAHHALGCKMLNPTNAVEPLGPGGCDKPSLQLTAHHACTLSNGCQAPATKQVGDT
eukprot:6306374-Karenia_brevis.AAC.1